MRLVEFPLEEGGSILVAVDEPGAPSGSVTRAWRDRPAVEQAQQSFEQAIGRVQPAVRAMLARLKAMTDAPDEVEVEFGVQLSAEAGAFVASVSTTGTFRVSMTWRSRLSPPRLEQAHGAPEGSSDA